MKQNLLKLTALSSLLLSAAALASDSADIKVIGELSTATCDVTMPNNGVFDFGKLSPSQVSETNSSPLGYGKEGNVRVKCTAPTALTFTVTDNRAATIPSTGGKWSFGLGNVNGTGKLGTYQLLLEKPNVDGVASKIFIASEYQSIPPTVIAVQVVPGRRIGWAPLSGAQELAVGKDFAFNMLVTAYLAKKGEMNGALTNEASLDGSATIEFGFGL